MVFGLNREKKIKKSGIREIFTPHIPVQDVKLFFGRETTVKKLIENLDTPGQHAMLFGDRGVGKSSLANTTTKILIESILNIDLYTKICDSGDNFQTIFRSLFDDIEEREEKDKSNNNKLVLKKTQDKLTPSYVAKKLSDTAAVFYIDEVDRLKFKKDKIELADTIKQLSDTNSPFKVLLVGIAETGDELRAGHLSVERCLKETKLKRMTSEEIREIIEVGAKKCNLSFNDEVIERIVSLSSGYPHFTHLLALKCAEKAIDTDQTIIDRYILFSAIQEAMKGAQGSLKRNYDKAVRSSKTDMFKTVLYAAAQIGSDYEFTITDWKERVIENTNEDMTTQKLNSYQRRLVSNNEGSLIKRIAPGIYKFNDLECQVSLELQTVKNQMTVLI